MPRTALVLGLVVWCACDANDASRSAEGSRDRSQTAKGTDEPTDMADAGTPRSVAGAGAGAGGGDVTGVAGRNTGDVPNPTDRVGVSLPDTGVPLPDASVADGGPMAPGDASGIPPAWPPPPVVSVDANGLHTCAVLAGGRVKCWGSDGYGMLGIEADENIGDGPGEMGVALPAVNLGTDITARQVAVGRWSSCALLSDDRIKCWGYRAAYAVGIGTISLGKNPEDMGDKLPFIPLPPGSGARAIAVTDGLGCAVLQDGTLAYWGEGADLGTTRVVDFGGRVVRDVAIDIAHGCVLFEDGGVRCWGDGFGGKLGTGSEVDLEWWSDTPDIDLGTGARATAIAVGRHTCALLQDGRVKCWGYNEYGELGLGDTEPRGDEPGEMGDALPAVDLGTGRTAVALDAGGVTTCALLDDGNLKCWGGGFMVQYGLGEPVHGDDPGEMGNALPPINVGTGHRITAVTTGDAHVCAVLDDVDLKCWGNPITGALGLGNPEFIGDVLSEMGDALPTVDLGGELLQD